MSNADVSLGTVTEELPGILYRVQLDSDGRTIICYVSGKMKLHKIKVLMGDKVEVVVDPYGGKTSNRIVRRLTPSKLLEE